jgi:hypothetical protein
MLTITLKEAEKAGYQATQATTLQQTGNVPAESTETAQNIEAPMDIDEEMKGAAGSMKRKAEEEPAEESKKPRVGECVRTGDSMRQLIGLYRATSNAKTVRLMSSDSFHTRN